MGTINKYRAMAGMLLMLLPMALMAEEKAEKLLFNLSAGIATNFDYNIEVSAYYRPMQWAGVGVGIGYLQRGTNQSPWPSGQHWEIDDDERKLANIYLRPSLLFTSPKLLRIKACSFYLFAEPGLVMK